MESQIIQTKHFIKNIDPSRESLLESAHEVTTSSDQPKLRIACFNASYTEDNYLDAFTCIKRAAEQGNMEAQFRLADLYSLGQGTSRSHSEAYKWYTKSAIQGYKKASIRIHNLYQGDIKMHCRGKLNSEEEHRKKPKKNKYDENEKTKYYYRELYEQRLDDNKLMLNHAIEYYTTQFEKYKSSNQEDPEVQQNLGFLYQHGYGVKKCDKWAIEYYTKAADQGYVDSQYQLGCLYQKSTEIKFNYKKAFHWYSLAAHGGNTAAQNCLAYFYEKGFGTDIDYQKVLSWYTKAAESGHSGAQLNLGRWYRKGEYITQNYDMAVKWYSLAARQGNSMAQNCLAQLYQTGMISDLTYAEDIPNNYICGSKKGHLCSKIQSDILKLNDPVLVENIKKLAKRALVGDGNSMYQIGLKYYYGTDFAVDKQIGFKWIKNAAGTGHEEAIFRVVKMYQEGDTVDQDYHKAAIWTKRVARTKNSKALCDLGILYNEGRGVRNDPLEASKWLTLSAEKGNSEAQYQLGCLRQEGRGLRKNTEDALKMFELSAKQGNTNGCYKFGLAVSNDCELGDEKTIEYDTTSINLLEYASKKGSTYAQCKLWKIYYDKQIKFKADFYFDMLMLSSDISIISKMMEHIRRSDIVSFGYIKFFNLLKKAENLGISTTQDDFRNSINFSSRQGGIMSLIQMFTLVFVEGISSIEYDIACGYEKLYPYSDDKEQDIWYAKAIFCHDVAAKKGDSRSQVQLGILCEEGIVVEKDFTKAIKYYNLAYEKGNKDAIYRLACMYLEGHGVSQDLEKAFQLFSQASDIGHIEARTLLMLPCNPLSEHFSKYQPYQQIAVKINDDNRIKMLEKMAKSGLVAIQYQLGTFYQNNRSDNEYEYESTEKDDLKAVKWFTLAAQNGVTDACYRLAVLYEKGRGTEQDYMKAMSFYEKAIRNEHEDSMYRLAQMYLYGKGIEINYKKAYQLYSKAAKMGHVLSCNILDFKLISNENSPSVRIKNLFLMFRHVAEEGDAELQYKLGYFYESISNERNYEEAAKWYSMAVDSSHSEAMYRFGLLCEVGSGAIQDYNKAIYLYHQAYNLGHYEALYRLGTIYQYGAVTDIDPERAIQYYTEAANQGHTKSQHALGKLYEEGLLIKKDTLEALRWYTRAYLKAYDPARIDLYAMYNDLPYEKYFFEKLNNILLWISKSIRHLNIEEYNETYGHVFYKLGIQYLYGSGATQDYAKALNFFKESDTKFHNTAARNIINLDYDGDKSMFLKTIDMYEALFDEIASSQQYILTELYYNGVSDNTVKSGPVDISNTVPDSNAMNDRQDIILARDYQKAIFYLERATAGSYHYYKLAQPKLAEMYIRGLGHEKNIEKMIECYTKASTEPNEYAFEIAQAYHFDNEFCDYSKAIEWYKRVESHKKERSLNFLGIIYKTGRGVKQNYLQALRYFKESADFGNMYACYNLGLMYYNGHGTEKNYSEAYIWFKRASENNHAKAQMYLAKMNLNDWDVDKDVQKAQKWYPKSLTINYNDSDNKFIWVSGIYYSIYRKEIIEWCKEIEESDPVISHISTEYSNDITFFDDTNYSYYTGSLIYRDYIDNGDNNGNIPEVISFNHKNSISTLMQVVELGERYSLYTIGEMYYDGIGVQKDYDKAYHYFLTSAEKNNSSAKYMLAEMYKYGKGVDRDIEKAIELYEKVKGNQKTAALFQIATLYFLGDGVEQHINRAIQFYTEAAVGGSDVAAVTLGELYHFNEKIQDFSKAFEWYQKVQGSNTSFALRGIGLLFEYGDGVDQDFQKSIEYYSDSIDSDNVGAVYNLALMYYFGKGVDQDYERCFALLNLCIDNEPVSESSYVFARAKNNSSAHDVKANRLYSLENETALFGEVYYQLGIMYKNGEGTYQSYEEARECFLKAIDYGKKQAKDEI